MSERERGKKKSKKFEHFYNTILLTELYSSSIPNFLAFGTFDVGRFLVC